MLSAFIKLSAVILIGYIVWSMLRPRYDMKLVITEQGIEHHEGLPKSRERSVLEFFESPSSHHAEIVFSGKVKCLGGENKVSAFVIAMISDLH